MSQTEVQLIKAAAVVTGDIADQAVTLDKLPHGTSSNDGKFLRANNGADPTFETVNTDLVSDTSPQLGGNLDTNSHEISLDTSHAVNFGDSNELKVFYHSGNGQIDFNGTTSLQLKTPANKYFQVVNRDNGNNIIQAQAGGTVELYHNGSKKLETTSTGITVTGSINSSGGFIDGDLFLDGETAGRDIVFDRSENALEFRDNAKAIFGTGDDLQIYHEGNHSYIQDAGTGSLILVGNNVTMQKADQSANLFSATENSSVDLYFNGSKKFETTSAGATLTGQLGINNTGGTAGQGELAFGESGRPFIEAFDSGNHGSGAGMNFRTGAGDYMAKMKFDNAVELYFDNSKKFETLTDGVNVTGTLKVNGSAFSSGASLANDGNNRIVTATGSGGLNGESTLTYNGSTFTNTGNTSFSRTAVGFTADTNGNIYSSNIHVAGAQFNRSGSGGRIVEFWNTVNSNSFVASVQGNHGQGSFNNHSDYRAKENVVAITDGITQLKKLKPKRFTMISDPAKYVHDGFLAHEVTPAVPCAVSGEKDGMMPLTYYEEGDTLPEGKYIGDPKTFSTTEIEQQTLDYSKLTPILTAALQETLTKVETLETEVAALKAA